MKPVVTWVVLANSRHAKVLEHLGPGKGLRSLSGYVWTAPEAGLPKDRAGMGHSIAGPGRAAVEQKNPNDAVEASFAKGIVDDIAKAQSAKKFDRLVLIAGPHTLGLLRSHIGSALHSAIVGEIPKDLSSQPEKVVEGHLGDVIAV